MKMKLILSILLISSLGLLSSCKKDEDSPKTKTEMLTGTSCWKLVKSELKNETGVYVDNTADSYDACELDDCTKFTTDGKFVSTDNGVKCDEGATVIEEGTWKLKNNDTELELTSSGGDTGTVKIEKLDSKNLITVLEVFGLSVRLTYVN